MRVLFDAYWWSDGPISNRSVQREFILTWASLFPADQLVLALRRDADASDVPSGARVVRTRLWPQALANRMELGPLARRVHADAILAHNYAPAGFPSVVFIHDVMFVDHPEWFSRAELLYFSPMLRWARGAAVVAASTSTEADRIHRLEPRLGEICVTGLGVPTALADTPGVRPDVLPETAEGFAVTVGRLNVRKNLELILAAAARSSRIDSRHPLVVVGTTAHSGVSTEFSAEVRRSLDQGRLLMVGGVDDASLAWLYRNASLAITLSLDEGFGMPAVETARFGVPLLASDIPVFRETVGGYADFIAPTSGPELVAAAIDGAWGKAPSTESRRAVRERYTWENAVGALRQSVQDLVLRAAPGEGGVRWNRG